MSSPSGMIAALVAEELTCLREFADLIAQEQAILQAGKADALPAISQAKAERASALSNLLARREAALSAAGIPAGSIGMAQWLAQLPPVERIAGNSEWTALLQLADRCRADHELNGKLIAIQLAHTQQALNALMTAGGQTLTYGPDGQQRIGGGRSLGSA